MIDRQALIRILEIVKTPIRPRLRVERIMDVLVKWSRDYHVKRPKSGDPVPRVDPGQSV